MQRYISVTEIQAVYILRQRLVLHGRKAYQLGSETSEKLEIILVIKAERIIIRICDTHIGKLFRLIKVIAQLRSLRRHDNQLVNIYRFLRNSRKLLHPRTHILNLKRSRKAEMAAYRCLVLHLREIT